MVAHVVRLLVPLMLLPGEVVFERGEVGLEMFFITKGEAEVLGVRVTESPSLQQQGQPEGTFLTRAADEVINVLRAGQFFGELALLLDGARTATVRATSMLHLYALSKEAIAKTIAEYPSLERSIRHVRRAQAYCCRTVARLTYARFGTPRQALEGAAGAMNRRAATEVRQRVVAEAYGTAWRTFAQERAAARARAHSMALSPGAAKMRTSPRATGIRSGEEAVSRPGTLHEHDAEAKAPADIVVQRAGAALPGASVPVATSVNGTTAHAGDAANPDTSRFVAQAHGSPLAGSQRGSALAQPYMSSMRQLDTMVRHANRLKHVPPALGAAGSSRSVLSASSYGGQGPSLAHRAHGTAATEYPMHG